MTKHEKHSKNLNYVMREKRHLEISERPALRENAKTFNLWLAWSKSTSQRLFPRAPGKNNLVDYWIEAISQLTIVFIESPNKLDYYSRIPESELSRAFWRGVRWQASDLMRAHTCRLDRDEAPRVFTPASRRAILARIEATQGKRAAALISALLSGKKQADIAAELKITAKTLRARRNRIVRRAQKDPAIRDILDGAAEFTLSGALTELGLIGALDGGINAADFQVPVSVPVRFVKRRPAPRKQGCYNSGEPGRKSAVVAGYELAAALWHDARIELAKRRAERRISFIN